MNAVPRVPVTRSRRVQHFNSAFDIPFLTPEHRAQIVSGMLIGRVLEPAEISYAVACLQAAKRMR